MTIKITGIIGWAIPHRDKKPHYFISGQALCGLHMHVGKLKDEDHDNPDNCQTCRERLKMLEDEMVRRQKNENPN